MLFFDSQIEKNAYDKVDGQPIFLPARNKQKLCSFILSRAIFIPLLTTVRLPFKLRRIRGRKVGDQLSIKVRLVQVTISGEEGKPPLMEVSLYMTNKEAQ